MRNCNKCELITEDGTCKAAQCSSPPCERYWIFTFGGDQPNVGKYVKIRGTFAQARQKMINKYGRKWAFQYSEEEWEEYKNDPKRYWPMETELEVIE